VAQTRAAHIDPMSQPDELLRTAEEVLAILGRHQLDAVVIGAVCARYLLGGIDELIAESRAV
jgi:hypothetical protein